METRAIMRRYALLLLLLASLWASRAQAQSERVVLVLTATGPLTPAMIEYLDRGLLLAERRGAEALVLQLDTPGGQIDHMNQMVQSIRASAVPVVVYIAPRGAIAARAGTALTLAGHAAAMAPETAIGAATPGGGPGGTASRSNGRPGRARCTPTRPPLSTSARASSSSCWAP